LAIEDDARAIAGAPLSDERKATQQRRRGSSLLLDPLFLTSLATAVAGWFVLVATDPEPIATMALIAISIGIVAVHGSNLRQRWVATTDAVDARIELTREVERSRRYGRQLSVAVVETPDAAAMTRLIDQVRSTDAVFPVADGLAMVILPETDAAATDRFIARIALPAARATFPADAHTAEALADVVLERFAAPDDTAMRER
jgi:hypothetical protein